MINVDPRVGSERGAGLHGRYFVQALLKLGAEAKLTRLAAGDVTFPGHGPDGGLVKVGIEVKTLADCLSSLDSGRLVGTQLPGLCSAYPYRYLLIQGIWRPDAQGILSVPKFVAWGKRTWGDAGHGRRRWTYIGFMRSLNSILVQAGVWWLRTTSLRESTWLVYALAAWWGDEWDQHSTLKAMHHRTPPRSHLTRPSLLRKWAADIPHIGWEYSTAVEAAFGNAVTMASADVAAWAAIRREGQTRDGRRRPQLGTKRAEQIVALLRGG